MDHFRNLKKHISTDLNSNEESDRIHFDSKGQMTPGPGKCNIDPEKAAENNELAKVLAACLEGLLEKFHKLFVLKEMDGLSSDEICKEFNIKPTNLWVILHRARDQLKLCLESNWLNSK